METREVECAAKYALGFLKPDCIKRGISDEVYAIIKKAGLKVVYQAREYLDVSKIEIIYGMCINKPYYPELCEYMLSGPVEVFVVEGNNAISTLQSLVGERGSANPSRNTIRGKYATSARENVIHSTTDEATHNIEIDLLLSDLKLQYKV